MLQHMIALLVTSYATAHDNIVGFSVLIQFFTMFPQYSKNDFYVGGQVRKLFLNYFIIRTRSYCGSNYDQVKGYRGF